MLEGIPFDLKNVYFPGTTGGTDDYFDVIGVPIFYESEIKGAIVTVDRVTSEIKSKLELKRVEERLSIALQGAKIGYWDHNLTNNNVWRSDTWFEMLGYERKDFGSLNEMWEKLLHPDDLEVTLKTVNDHLNGRTNDIQDFMIYILSWKVIQFSKHSDFYN